MSGHWHKVVSGACKPKHAPPKSKYIDALVSCTYQSDGSFQDVSRALRNKLRDPNSSVVFKALLVIHTLIRAGNPEEVMSYWSGIDGRDGRSLGLNDVSATNDTPQNLSRYANYLLARFKCYSALKHDPIRTRSEAPASLRNASRNGANRLRTLTVEKGLLREVGILQKLMDALVECKFYLEDTDDDLVMSALRLLVKDLLILFQAVNEGVINVLEHYFEMSFIDATTALKTYKIFCKQCEKVVAYLGVAKKLQKIINVNVPNLRHAPVSLAGSLEEYLNDPNFESNREEYRESKRVADGKPAKKVTSKPMPTVEPAVTASQPPPASTSQAQKTFTDFFESIESEQTSMFNPNSTSPNMNYFEQQSSLHPFQSQSHTFPVQNPPQMQALPPTNFIPPQPTSFMNSQPTGFINPQQTGFGRASMGQALFGSLNGPNPPQFIQNQPTGFAMGGQMTMQPQMTGANPFRQSTMTNTSQPFGTMAPQPTGYNPFLQQQQQASHAWAPDQSGLPDRNNGAMSAPPGSQFSSQPINAFDGSTNTSPLKPQVTGSRNPFAPPPGSMPAVPKLPDTLSLNALAASAFSQSMVQQRAREQAAMLQQQQQQQKQTLAAPREPSISVEEKQVAEQKAQFANFFSSQLSKLEGGGKDANGAGRDGTGGLFTSVASEFAVTKPKEEPTDQMGVSSSFLGSQPTGFNPSGSFLSSQPTGFQPSASFDPTASFLNKSQPTEMMSGGGTGPLTSQVTGFGGSMIKPFQPSSSFGASLAQSLSPSTAAVGNPFRASGITGGTGGGGGGQVTGVESLI